MDLNSVLCDIEFPWAAVSLDSPVEAAADEQFTRWLREGRHGGMAYLEKYPELRHDPRVLFPGAKTLIVIAFPYYTDEAVKLPVSLYSRGRDYHEVVRERLSEIAMRFQCESRVCVDTAPLRERYWAQRAGLGFIGKNNQLIIPEKGSYFFLGEILLKAEFELESAMKCKESCGGCNLCVRACPGGCLSDDGSGLDARRCLSYLTIEHRGDFDSPLRGLTTIYGCDVCQRVCPHNKHPHPTPIADFHPSREFAELTIERLQHLTPEEFNAIFRHSAIKRTKLVGLQRNLRFFAKLTENT